MDCDACLIRRALVVHYCKLLILRNQPSWRSVTSGMQQQSVSSSAPTTTAPPEKVQPSATRKITAYTLSPDLYKKAHNLNRIRFRLALIGFVYGIAVLWLILRWKLAPKYR